jgi:hypothetical protein
MRGRWEEEGEELRGKEMLDYERKRGAVRRGGEGSLGYGKERDERKELGQRDVRL